MEDLLALTEHLLKKINNRQHTSKRHIADKAWRRLKDYTWPGNIRELENILTRSAVLGTIRHHYRRFARDPSE
jgi:two-component system response regulator AtoC